jgi:predicted DNA-binding transcriptional regulator YafY
MTLPPLNFTPSEAAAVAVGLRRLDDTPWARDARTALLKIVSAMPDGAASRARALADGVRLMTRPLSPPDQAVADAVLRAVEAATPIRIDYIDVGGLPSGSYVSGWCRLRGDERVFRIDRIRSVETVADEFTQPVTEFGVDDYETRTAAWS